MLARFRSQIFSCSIVACWVGLYFSDQAFSQMTPVVDDLQTIAISFEDAPGTVNPETGDGSFFRSFESAETFNRRNLTGPSLNDLGHTAFNAQLNGGGIGPVGIFSNGGGNGLHAVVISNQEAPSSDFNDRFDILTKPFDLPLLSNTGRTLFRSQVEREGTDRSIFGIYEEGTNGELEAIAVDGQVLAGNDLSDIFPPKISDSGDVTFRAFGNNDGTFEFANYARLQTGITVVSRRGDPVSPALSAEDTRIGSFTETLINNQSDFAYSVRLEGNQANTNNDTAILLASDNGTNLLAREGSASPVTNKNFGVFQELGLNDQGDVVFNARLSSGNGAGGGPFSGIFVKEKDGEFKAVATNGEAAPVADSSDVRFGNFNAIDNRTVINNSGKVAFSVSLTGDVTSADNYGIFSISADGEQELIARRGDYAPELDPDSISVFDGNGKSLAINDFGQVAFSSFLDVNGTEEFGIFIEDVSGILRLIARTGLSLDVSDDPNVSDFREIDDIGFSLFSGAGSGFNDQGQFAFSAAFTNGTQGIFVSDVANLVFEANPLNAPNFPASVPEPSSLAFISIGLIAVGCRRRRAK